MKETNQYLTFTMRGERYALEVGFIREVLAVPKVTYIPQMPEYMSGVINVRGAAVPLIDLGYKFGIGKIAITPATAIIIVEMPTENPEDECPRFGVYVDTVEKVISIAPEQIDPPPKIGSRINTTLIKGVGHVDDDFVVILDITAILSDDDLVKIESAALPEGATEGETIPASPVTP
jgi:purine-binding chemotaxis protein CheW